MALLSRVNTRQSLIHHSDRGVQYCSKPYVEMLTEHHVAISMTENGDPYENAIAERVNGILKTEFNLYSSQSNFEETCRQVKHCIEKYNHLRPHSSCEYLTPVKAHECQGELKKRW
jgi:putative transposase